MSGVTFMSVTAQNGCNLRAASAPSWIETGQPAGVVVLRTAPDFFQREIDGAERRSGRPAELPPLPGTP